MNKLTLLVLGLIILLLSSCTSQPHNTMINTQQKEKQQAILKVDTKGHTSMIWDILVTKSGDIVSASTDKTIRVYDSKTGKEKRKILGEIGIGNSGKIYAIALSSDENYLAVGGFFNDPNDVIRIYNFKTGKLVRVLKSHKDVVYDLSFSMDSTYLISGSRDKTAKIWEVKNDFSLKDTISFHNDDVYAVKIIQKQNSYFAITAAWDNQIALYDISKKMVIKSAKSKYKLMYLATSKKNNFKNSGHIAVSGYGGEIKIYDFKLNLIKTIKNRSEQAGLNYSEDGKYLIAGAGKFPMNINIYKVNKSYRLFKKFKKHNNTTKAVNFLNNNIAISAGGNNNEIYIWNINSKKVKTKIEGVGKPVWSVAIKNNNIAWGNKSGYKSHNNRGKLQKIINLNNFKIKDLNSKKFNRISTSNGIYTLKHSKGGAYKYSDGILDVYNYSKKVSQIVKNDIDGYHHRCYGWYKNYIISGGSNGHLKIYNKRGKEIASLIGHTGEVWSIDIDKDILVSASSDQTIKIWNLANLKERSKEFDVVEAKWFDNSWIKWIDKNYSDIDINKKDHRLKLYNRLYQDRDSDANKLIISAKIYPILNILVSKNNEYIAWTKEGFFDASKNAGKYIGYHINQGSNKEAQYVTVDSLYNTFYRPDLIQQALVGESIEKYSKNINIQKLLKGGLAPEVHILTKTKNTKKQDMDLKVQVCPKDKGGYNNLTLLINDTPVSVIDTSRALKLKRKSKRDDCFIYNQTISLLGGKNTIGFKATNKAGNIESKPDFLEVTFDDTNLKNKLRSKLSKISDSQNINDLHILAIAVNEYKDNNLKLNYSINDATQMLKTIQIVSKPLFNKVHTYKLFDRKVTKENIKDIFKTIKSTREDVFLLYIAGHGITDQYNGNYYYIPYDFISKDDEKSVQKQGVGQRDLMLGLSKITALKSLVLLDTCNSGSFVEANMQKTTTNRLAKATGRATISASSKSQVALEGYKGHGVFTYTLLEALKGKGYNDDNKITINELSDYVEDTLPNRTNKKWGYRQMPQSSMYGVDFNIGIDKNKLAPKKFYLTIKTKPNNTKVQIMNIVPKYHDRMKLKKGIYKIKISKSGYITKYKNINLKKDIILSIKLNKESKNYIKKTTNNENTSWWKSLKKEVKDKIESF